jgi:hypothetical protein
MDTSGKIERDANCAVGYSVRIGMMGDVTDGIPDPVPEPAVQTPSRYITAGIAVLAVAAAIFASFMTFQVLNSLENSPEDYKVYGERITLMAFVATLGVAAAGALGWQHPRPIFGRAFRFAALAGLVALVCSGCPVPGGMVAGSVLLIAAARLFVAALTPIACLVRPQIDVPPSSVVLAAALTAFAASAGALLALKRDGLGWAFGID